MSFLWALMIVIWIIIMFIFVVYVFVGVWAIPFYALWFLYKLLFFPIVLINQYIYPVWTLPRLVLISAVVFFFFRLFMYNAKKITSLKPEKPKTKNNK